MNAYERDAEAPGRLNNSHIVSRFGSARRSRHLRIATHRVTVMLALLAALIAATAQAAQPQTFATLYSFAGSPNDGAIPWAGVILDARGNLYGTTVFGGSSNCGTFGEPGCGTVFRVTPEGSETVLHSFAGPPNDGASPYASVVMNAQGNLYGTTSGGGVDNPYCDEHDSPHKGCGTVFKLDPSGAETVLHRFHPAYFLPILPLPQRFVTDGALPRDGLILDGQSNLYGATSMGGLYSRTCLTLNVSGCGTVFEITPAGSEKALHVFDGPPNDERLPSGPLVMDAQGNFYGAAGNSYGGAVFKMTPSGTLTALYSFCSQNGCVDGLVPNGGLVFDAAGNLYGTTFAGGAYGQGTVFEITPSGTETVLYSFCPNIQQGSCPDGAGPESGLVMDAQGNLYGTTSIGGLNRTGGTVFEVTAPGTEKVLYSFCSQPNCTDGNQPVQSLVIDAQGNLYGTTTGGGAYNKGTVFKLTP